MDKDAIRLFKALDNLFSYTNAGTGWCSYCRNICNDMDEHDEGCVVKSAIEVYQEMDEKYGNEIGVMSVQDLLKSLLRRSCPCEWSVEELKIAVYHWGYETNCAFVAGELWDLVSKELVEATSAGRFCWIREQY